MKNIKAQPGSLSIPLIILAGRTNVSLLKMSQPESNPVRLTVPTTSRVRSEVGITLERSAMVNLTVFDPASFVNDCTKRLFKK
ncbi:MAG: hypothetical protein ACUVUR_00840 [bacterium]